MQELLFLLARRVQGPLPIWAVSDHLGCQRSLDVFRTEGSYGPRPTLFPLPFGPLAPVVGDEDLAGGVRRGASAAIGAVIAGLRAAGVSAARGCRVRVA